LDTPQLAAGRFIEYLNFHRPCAFPIEVKDKKGKIRKDKEEI